MADTTSPLLNIKPTTPIKVIMLLATLVAMPVATLIPLPTIMPTIMPVITPNVTPNVTPPATLTVRETREYFACEPAAGGETSDP